MSHNDLLEFVEWQKKKGYAAQSVAAEKIVADYLMTPVPDPVPVPQMGPPCEDGGGMLERMGGWSADTVATLYRAGVISKPEARRMMGLGC